MTHSTRTSLLAMLLIAVLALAACADDDGGDADGESSGGGLLGGSDVEDDPQAAFDEALEAAGEWDGSTARVSLVSTPESLQALAAEDGAELSTEDAERILSAALTIETDGTELDANSRFAFELEDTTLGEVITIGQELIYARIDLDAIASAFPDVGSPDELRGLMGMIGEAGTALGNGEWIVMDAQELQDQAEAMAGESIEQPEVSEEDVENFQSEMLDAFAGASDVTFVETDDLGDRLTVTADLAPILETFQSNAALLGLSPEEAAELEAEEVPQDAVVTFDVWIDGGEFVQFEVDPFEAMAANDIPAEDLPEGVEQLVLRIGLGDGSGSISEPSDAVQLDLMEMMGGMMGAPGGDPFGDMEDGDMGDFDEDAMFEELCEDFENDPVLQDDEFLAEICA